MTHRKTTLTLRLVVEERFSEEDEAPSLPGVTIDTTAEPAPAAPLAKCRPEERKRRAS